MAAFIIDRTWNGEAVPHSEIVRMDLKTDGDHLTIRVEAPFHGDPVPPGEPGSTDRLWEYEVAEVFLVGEAGDYLEIEMGPHGHFLVLKLKGVRCVEKTHLPIDYHAEIKGETWQGFGRIPLTALPRACVRANAFAIHGTGENRRYLCAVPTGGDVPDFHLPGRFPSFSL